MTGLDMELTLWDDYTADHVNGIVAVSTATEACQVIKTEHGNNGENKERKDRQTKKNEIIR